MPAEEQSNAQHTVVGLPAPKDAVVAQKWYKRPLIRGLLVAIAFITVIVAAILLGVFYFKPKRPPNIILFVVDDLGWSDVSFHANGQIPTPNIDALCSDAVLLNSHYSQPSCTPSRASLLTGKYAVRTGFQEYVIRAGTRVALSLNHKLLPEYLNELGYESHLVGKWHLGYYAPQFLPHNRGFKSFYGYYNGAGRYYDHTNTESNHTGYDWSLNGKVDESVRGQYVTDIITKRVKDLVRDHREDPTKPMFLMISHMAPHGGMPDKVYEVNETWIHDPAISHIKDSDRTQYAAMIRALDAAFGETMVALEAAQMLDNSIVLFTSDNGGTSLEDETFKTGASNWPLRGQKFSLWEGGMRVASFLWSPLLKSRRYVNTQLYHFTDWLPTIYALAGGDLKDLPSDIDGYDIWTSLTDNADSPREVLFHNYDTGGENYFAVRRGHFKVINGTATSELPAYDKWYASVGGRMDNSMHLQKYMKRSAVYKIVSNRPSFEDRKDNWRDPGKIRCKINTGLADSPRGEIPHSYSPEEMNRAATVNGTICVDTTTEPCLFNLEEDPCELRQYMGSDRDLIIEELTRIAETYKNITVESLTPYAGRWGGFESEAAPERHEGAWAPWVKDIDTTTPNPV